MGLSEVLYFLHTHSLVYGGKIKWIIVLSVHQLGKRCAVMMQVFFLFGLFVIVFLFDHWSSTDFAALRMAAFGVKTIFGAFRLSAVTSASVSIILAQYDAERTEACQTTLCPTSRASRTIAPQG